MIDATILPYIGMFLVAALPAFFCAPRWNRVAWPLAGILFVLFIGLRHRVGADWFPYIRITREVSSLSFSQMILDPEPLFALVAWTSSNLGLGVYGTNFAGAAIFCFGLFSFCARQPNRWLALAAASPFLVVAGAMSANKQAIAVGVVLFVMSRWNELNLRSRVFGIVVAGLFHFSALILLVLTIVNLRVSRLNKIGIALLAGVVAVWLLSRPDASSNTYAEMYLFEQANRASGAFWHLLLNLAPAIFILITRDWWAKKLPNWELIQSLSWLVIIMALMVPLFSQAVSRMSLYLFPVSITFFAWLPRMTVNTGLRHLVRLSSVAALALVMTVWISYSNQAPKYRPYQNALLTDVSALDLPR